MENLNAEIQERLKRLAYKKTIPYCYSCAIEVPRGRCHSCLSDDLMRLMPEEGCDWGVDWVIRALVRNRLTPINLNEVFEQSIQNCYPETTRVGWLELETISIIREMDPLSWRMAISEWTSNEESEGLITSFDYGSTYYQVSEIESFLNEAENELDMEVCA